MLIRNLRKHLLLDTCQMTDDWSMNLTDRLCTKSWRQFIFQSWQHTTVFECFLRLEQSVNATQESNDSVTISTNVQVCFQLLLNLIISYLEQKSPSISVNITCRIPAEIECLGKIENVSVHFRIDGSYIQMQTLKAKESQLLTCSCLTQNRRKKLPKTKKPKKKNRSKPKTACKTVKTATFSCPSC